MLQKLVPVWTHVEVPALIECTLEWHMENRSKLQLMLDFRTDPLPAHILAIGPDYLLVHCQGLPKCSTSAIRAYTLLGKNAGGDVMLNGEVTQVSDSGDVLTLRIPQSIAVGTPQEYQPIAAPAKTPLPAIRKSYAPAIRKCRAAHRIIGNGLCIRRGSLHWFSHLRRFV